MDVAQVVQEQPHSWLSGKFQEDHYIRQKFCLFVCFSQSFILYLLL